MATCKNCLHACACFDGDNTTKYYRKDIAAGNVEQLCHNYKPKEKPQTIADLIRAMSDEKLAETFARVLTNFSVQLLERLECTTEETAACLEETKEEFLEWLKQPARED